MKIVETIKARCVEGIANVAAKEVAVIIRAKLKAAFPGEKFSVTSDHSSVDIRWKDGPASSDVEAITSKYRFGGFDGSIDMAFDARNWLLPNGEMLPAESQGTTGSMGYHKPYVTDCPVAGAFIVQYGPRYVFCHRTVTDERYDLLLRKFCDKHAYTPELGVPLHNLRWGSEFLSTVLRRQEAELLA